MNIPASLAGISVNRIILLCLYTISPACKLNMHSSPSTGLKGARLFTHSYLGLGFDAALQKAADTVKAAAAAAAGSATSAVLDPCLPVG